MANSTHPQAKSIHTSPIAVKKAACPTLALAAAALLAPNPDAQIADFATRQRLVGCIFTAIYLDTLCPYSTAAGACNWGNNDFGHRDRNFHAALGDFSAASVKAGSGMVSAVVVRVNGRPGDEFWPLWEKLRDREIPREPISGEYTDSGKTAAWNEELSLLGMTPSLRVPGPSASWGEIQTFAQTFNGYVRFGNDQCGALANAVSETYQRAGELPADLEQLRNALFFEQRRAHHIGSDPDERSMGYIRALVAKIAEHSRRVA
jgi:hypothetical protein